MSIIALLLAQTNRTILYRLGEHITDHGMAGYGPVNVRTLRRSDASAARINADNYRWYAQVSPLCLRGIRIHLGALYADYMTYYRKSTGQTDAVAATLLRATTVTQETVRVVERPV